MTAPSDVRRDDASPAPGRSPGRGDDGAPERCPHCRAPVDDAWLACASCARPLAVEAELSSGALLGAGRFEVLWTLGRGGFGITYDVMDHRLQRRVAVKELFPESAVRHGSMVLTPPHARAAFRDARQRFLREAQVLARFTHPGIVRVYEVFEEHNTAYLVMELLRGRNLLDLLRSRDTPFTEPELLDVAARVAAALRSIHAAGILHRDINPSNIVLTDDGRIVVIDFGLARSYLSDRSAPLTQVVTPGYAPPEQYMSDDRVGPASDVYALAATLYRLGTGRIPVPALERHGGEQLPAPHRLNPAISKVVSDGLLDGLEINPDHRPQTLEAFLQRLGLADTPRAPRSMLIDTMPLAAPPADATTPTVPPADTVSPTVRPGHRDADRTVVDRPGYRTLVQPREPATELAREPAATDPSTARTPAATDPSTARTAPLPPVGGRLAFPPPGVAAPHGMSTGAPAEHTGRLDAAVGPTAAAGTVPAHLRLAPTGRWKITLPVAVAVLAVASAAPLVMVAALVLVALPVLATWGDAAIHQARRQAGTSQGWVGRSAPVGAVAPVRLVGNVVLSALRALPVVALTVALLALCYGLDRLGAAPPLADGAVRGVGLLVAALLIVPARHGSPRFRTGVGIDDITVRLLGPGGRLGQRGLVLWVGAAFVTVAGLWFHPDLWPFRR